MCTSMTLSSDVVRAVSFQTSRASVPRETRLSLVTHQILDQLEFTDGELDRLAAAHHLSSDEVELQIAHAKTQRLGHTAAAQQRPNARQDLFEGERLDQIIIGAAIETGDPILSVSRAVRISTGVLSPRVRSVLRM